MPYWKGCWELKDVTDPLHGRRGMLNVSATSKNTVRKAIIDGLSLLLLGRMTDKRKSHVDVHGIVMIRQQQ